jgi:hypothetical protein
MAARSYDIITVGGGIAASSLAKAMAGLASLRTNQASAVAPQLFWKFELGAGTRYCEAITPTSDPKTNGVRNTRGSELPNHDRATHSARRQAHCRVARRRPHFP